MRNIKLVVEYDGTAYCGWQCQPDVPTVQGVLENRLAQLTGTPVRLHGSGRTDAGVHAAGQVANFCTASTIPLVAFEKGLNAMLPCDIVVGSAAEVPSAFHARFSAVSRRYRYTLLNRSYRSAVFRRTSYFYPRSVDIRRLESACQVLVGRHDFSSFQKSGSDRLSPVCEVSEVRWWGESPYIYFEIEADSFLRGMVRAITGTVLKYAGCADADAVLLRILAARDRSAAGMSAPAHGLSLIRVRYNNEV